MKNKFIVFALVGLGMIGSAFSERGVGQVVGGTPATDSFETVKEYLLDSAATDFFEHQPPMPVRFRKVRIGYLGKDKKDVRLCGEFFPANEGKNAKWTGFTTLKTSKYEQYIGSSTSYCTDPNIRWAKTRDLSATLKKRLDALKKD